MSKKFAVPFILFCLSVVVVSAEAPYASAKPLPEPVVFGAGVISTGDYESHPAFTPDGSTVYFLKDTPDVGFWTIVVSHYVDGKWTTPEVAPFSGQYGDADPFITADGSRFYFISNRTNNGKVKEDTDIWMMEKTANGWSDPVRLPEPVNSSSNEWYPTVASDDTLYFGSNRSGSRGNDIYKSRFTNGQFQSPENLGEPINTDGNEYEPWIAPDQSYLIFMARRAEGIGGFDIYISFQEKGRWTQPRNLGKQINTPGDEYSPKISPDGRYFFFSSPRPSTFSAGFVSSRMNYEQLLQKMHEPGNGLGDIYQMDSAPILKKK